MTPEHQLRVEEWRAKAAAGTLTKEDCIEIVQELRKARGVAMAPAQEKVKKTPAKKAIQSGEDLLSGLDNF
jgi:ribosomal protein L12E/L44/L45/RPP1/RPP2